MFKIADHSASDLAARFGTPLYVLDLEVVSEQVDRIRLAFPEHKADLYYSIKANPNPHLLKHLSSKGVGFDACSAGDLYLAGKLNLPEDRITFTGVGLPEELTARLHGNNILTNLDSVSELKRWLSLEPARPVGMRIAPEIQAGFSEHCRGGEWGGKMGISREELPSCMHMARQQGTRIHGLHMHIGSGMEDYAPVLQAASSLLSYFQEYPELEYINIGGGLAPSDHDEEEFPLMDFSRELLALIDYYASKRGSPIRLKLEPGEFLVCRAGWIISRVMVIKNWHRDGKDKRSVILDASMNHFPGGTLYGTTSPVVYCRNPGAAPELLYTLYGNTNQSGDRFGDERLLPRLDEGDLLAIGMTGAYSSSRAANFNEHLFAPEVVCHKGRCTLSVRGQDYEHLFARMNLT